MPEEELQAQWSAKLDSAWKQWNCPDGQELNGAALDENDGLLDGGKVGRF